ncbi:hypothetical protein P7K49_031267 [Saguinus oedipus]|uniref:NIDO domain-containing protein n=1 Tax=Saguinus oedipus TaxID=9490 RepID=A0ABQ9TYZ8_SAGOE|nr:hypothetical protein P7K49_031267 [Saguinus oedipus]
MCTSEQGLGRVGDVREETPVTYRHRCVCSQTNTYQAILSTDGSRSYALFLYQSVLGLNSGGRMTS